MADMRYVPNPLRGYATFECEPKPSNEVLDLIGTEGVEQIHEQFKTMLDMRKKMYGCFYDGRPSTNYGFSSIQSFIDMDSRVMVQAHQKVENDIPYATTSNFHPYFEDGKLTNKGPTILNDHYTIEIMKREIGYKAKWRIEKMLAETTFYSAGIREEMKEAKNKAMFFKKFARKRDLEGFEV